MDKQLKQLREAWKLLEQEFPKPINQFKFSHTCTDSDMESIHDLQDTAEELTRKQFLRFVDRKEMKQIERTLGYDKWLTMSKDWHVYYAKGTYRGQPAVFFTHSHIEFIFLEE